MYIIDAFISSVYCKLAARIGYLFALDRFVNLELVGVSGSECSLSKAAWPPIQSSNRITLAGRVFEPLELVSERTSQIKFHKASSRSSQLDGQLAVASGSSAVEEVE